MSWWWAVLLQYYSVLQSTTPILLRTRNTTLYYSSTTLYYKVLLKYYSVLLQYYLVLQSTSPVLTCTTKYYSSNNLYYKVLLQYYPVLQSTTPVLLCTTKNYSNTTVLQSTTPILLRTTNTTLYYSSTTKYHSSTTLYYSSTTLYYKVLLQYYPVLQSTFTIWNVIYNARSNKRQPPTSANTAPATQNESHDWSASHMKRNLQCAEQQASPSNFTKYCACHAKWISWMIDPHHIWNVIYNARSNSQHPATSPNTAPATQNESHDWSTSHMKRHLQCAEQQASPSNFTNYGACHAKRISWLIHITYETSFTMCGATGITLQPHQILHLPRKMNLMIDPHHIWNVIYNARSNRHHLPTSPITAPATQKESHDWSTSHMKRHLQCAEQQASPSNLTKYCTCLAKWISWLIRITYETSFTMHGATGISVQPHQILRLPRKRSVMIDPHHIWNVIYNARSDRHHPATSPNTAPATQNCTPKS